MQTSKGSVKDAAEAAWFWDWDEAGAKISPEHAKFQQVVRKFVDDVVLPNIDGWEEAGCIPRELHSLAYEAGVYGAGWPTEYGGTAPGELDIWHRFNLSDQLGRACAGGLVASLFTLGISLPPILALGSEAQKARYGPDIIAGRKLCSLAITEPNAGSDVAGLQTSAVLDGDVYVVNGVKTFISGGMDADYFTVGVRTGAQGLQGISLLMIHKEYPGVRTSRLKTQGWHCSTTTTIAFDKVRVPSENLLGSENMGFLPIMLNFNNERFMMSVGACRMARTCLEDAIRYARLRKTFGQPLIKHQVIRHKLAEMARHIYATHGMLSTITQDIYSGTDIARTSGQSALAKVQATRTLEFCAREASQILGGKSYLRGGVGARIERSYREVRVYAIGGGSEEIMLDLATRQAKL
eukprot:TRINITY_DN26143_c0_g1_i1.p1 TRINITY_DN26143_c0_g1~~TRINITY_DN26143_c0_g1_i1.p1  ORF type:complete len:409 (+),score=59.91 TRINITY_DN26143_c0_g1_i1:31-1257(+)